MRSISKPTFAFLADLAQNNDREWFGAHKKQYQAAKEEFLTFVDEVIAGISAFDPSIVQLTAKDCIFRINRDVRFSTDKSPYQTYFGAHILGGGRKNEHGRSGYYIRLQPGDCMLAGGAYLPPAPWIKAIRDEIAYNAAEFKEILAHPDFKRYFGEMEGERLKTAPKGFARDHPEIDLLQFKSFLAVHRVKDEQAMKPDFSNHTVSVFQALYPFGQFLNRSMD